jgi:uncharacterized protein YndB with AHSA1/START domain
MPREFETTNELTVHATPEQVWDAIATGPGVNAWFLGRTEIEPGESVRTRFPGGFTLQSTVTDWDPPRRLAYRAEPAENGEFHAFEFLVEGREGSTTVVRMVHSGALANWDDEFDAMREGDAIYAGKLAAYLDHFAGKPGRSFFSQQEKDGDRDVRTGDAILRVFHAMGTLVVEEHRYGGPAPRDWQGWLDRVAA